MIKIYIYAKCSTCRNALQWLDKNDIPYQPIAIRDQPPTIPELTRALQLLNGDLRKLFNTSGIDYRELGLKDKLPTMTTKDALKLLSQNGNLVKRPFVLTDHFVLTGFKPEEWTMKLSKT